MFAFAENIQDLKKIIDDAAIEALNWLQSNKMIANPDKFKSIVLKKPSFKTENINITVGNLEIIPATSVKSMVNVTAPS